MVAVISKARSHPTRRSLRRDLLWATLDGFAALVLAALIYAVQVRRVHAGTDSALIEMPRMLPSGGIWAYSWSQAVGWVALAWCWMTLLLGISLPLLARLRQSRLRGMVEHLHRCTSLTLIALALVHAVALVWDTMGDGLAAVLVPWMTAYLPGRFPQALGIVSLYMAVLLGVTFYIRGRIGSSLWRMLHRYGVPAVYVLAGWHTLLYGSDIKDGSALRSVLWIVQIPVVGAFLARVWMSSHTRWHLAPPGRAMGRSSIHR